MKIRVVSTRNEILSLNPNEKVVHLAFRPSNKDVFLLVETCPKLEVLQLPKSYRRTVSRAIEMFLEMQKVELFEGDVWGHRKDISEYFIIPPSVISKIRGMKAEGAPAERIVEKIAQESNLDPKMVSYIMNRKDLE
jgi:hypothetical protein